MQTSRAARCDDNGLCPCHKIVVCLHVQQDGSGRLPSVILDQLNSGGEFHHRDLTVQHLVPQRTHDLSAGIILTGMHSLSGGSSAMGRHHPAVRILVKHDSQLIQPLDRIGGLHNEPPEKLRPCGKMSAAESVKVMLYRGIIFLVGSLDAALGHHGIGVADAKLRHDHDVCSGLMSLDGRGCSRSAASDDQHIHIVIHLIQVDIYAQKTAVGVKEMPQLARRLLPLIRPDPDLRESVLPVIRMIRFQKGILFVRRHAPWFCLHTFCSRGFYFFYRLEHFWCKHEYPLLFLNLSVVVKFLHLRDRLLHDLPDQIIVNACVDLLYTVIQML